MNEPIVMMSGNLASDVRYMQTVNGVAMASFRFATTPRHFDRNTKTWVDDETIYYGVTCWRFLADNVRDSIRKGDPVFVHGRLRQRTWHKDGRSGIEQEVTAEAVGHDLTRGVTRFAKVVRSRTPSPDGPDRAVPAVEPGGHPPGDGPGSDPERQDERQVAGGAAA